MTKGRDNAAESLGDVLELVRMRRQSGLLSVERMQGGHFEEGEIYFQHGQPMYASTGQMNGHEALVWLLSWHPVYFTFSSGEPRFAANIPAANTSKEVLAVPDNKGLAFQASARRPSSNTDLALNVNRALPNTPSGISPVNTPGLFNEEAARDLAYPRPPDAPSSTVSTPGLEWLVPQKLGNGRDVLSLPLTRPQRSIYLLIDGHRSVADLARCTRKSLQEIERLLSELQEHGLISI